MEKSVHTGWHRNCLLEKLLSEKKTALLGSFFFNNNQPIISTSPPHKKFPHRWFASCNTHHWVKQIAIRHSRKLPYSFWATAQSDHPPEVKPD